MANLKKYRRYKEKQSLMILAAKENHCLHFAVFHFSIFPHAYNHPFIPLMFHFISYFFFLFLLKYSIKDL
jgi:hypothetical protein